MKPKWKKLGFYIKIKWQNIKKLKKMTQKLQILRKLAAQKHFLTIFKFRNQKLIEKLI